MPAQFPPLKSGFLLYCVGYGIREYSLKSYLTLAGGRTVVANAVHLAGPERVHHTAGAMELLPADASALVICELRWAWRVVGDSCAATARCAGHGVCSCCGVMRVMAMWCDFQQLGLRENPRHKTSSLYNRFWSCQPIHLS